MKTGRTDAAYRLECEARSWIKQGYYTQGRVDELMKRITQHRGQEAATALRAEMRTQWKQRSTWLDSNNVK